MNGPRIVATAAFLLLPQINSADAAGTLTANGPVPRYQSVTDASQQLLGSPSKATSW
jgi:hypothetical protein